MRRLLAALVALMGLAQVALAAPTELRIGDLTHRPGESPRRLVGYGLVVGLDGTGDRSFGLGNSGAPSVRSVVNLLRRFGVQVPDAQMRLRNVAAVLVTAESSPWLREGGRFDVDVSAMGDATSLRGGVLWTTPLVADPGEPSLGTAQGTLVVPVEDAGRYGGNRRGNHARVPDGGVLEIDPPIDAMVVNRLLLDRPDLAAAQHIAEAVNGAFGPGTARVTDPGTLALQAPASATDTPMGFLAAVDTLVVRVDTPARIVLDARRGTLVAGGDVPVGPAVVQYRGVTLEVGAFTAAGADSTSGLVRLPTRASVRDVAAGLHAAGVDAEGMAAIFEALHAAGALRAEVVVR